MEYFVISYVIKIMKRKYVTCKFLTKPFLVVLLTLCMIMISCGCSLTQTVSNGYMASEIDSLTEKRPAEATAVPDFSQNITDIRVTVVPRTMDVVSGKPWSAPFEDISLLQVYYGYQADGVWHDIPCENYDLKGIFQNSDLSGYEAAGNHHLVKIGPFLLICYIYNGVRDDIVCTITDSLGTDVKEPFEQYFTRYDADENADRYGYLKEDRQSIIDGDLKFLGTGTFGKFYFLGSLRRDF